MVIWSEYFSGVNLLTIARCLYGRAMYDVQCTYGTRGSSLIKDERGIYSGYIDLHGDGNGVGVVVMG